MEYRSLGKTGLKVSFLGFGGIPIQRVTEPEACKIVEACVEKGINFFDSARVYSDSERKIRQGIKGKRDKVILATKSMARTAGKMTEDIEKSLSELGTDYIDLYQCHNVSSQELLDEIMAPHGAMEALLKAQKEGKIRFIGISAHRSEALLSAMKTGAFTTIQLPYNFIERYQEEKVLPLAHELDMGIIVMKPLAGGALSRPDLALKFLSTKDVSSIIPGIESLEQLEQNLDAVLQRKLLTADELEYMTKEAEKIGSRFCRRCDYCQPCPQGVKISSSFIFHGYFERYDMARMGQDRYRQLPVKADACIECGLCETRCPYNLPIREMLKKAHRDLG